MAVRTSHFTFRNLHRYPFPTDAPRAQYPDALNLVTANVIEFEHAVVGLAAVDAGSARQVLSEITSVSPATALLVDVSPAVVQLTMLAVVSL
jgi:hypothetical protein